ncbi:TetR family transcriptional regulator [Paraburkholderia sp. BL6665CI2N2]|uniref:TetR/AcrR family transcriptional regulator n=1 Tax=Paraburkholderia sp. BL6665CI2N2 TaxID=1938806 RepID=UPI0010663B45|nr:TetR/AcrR family transcriptional regulator [Paraburkholderia sp. BL6665CI2N2]TDY27084.1 TetR family transcriptional regulator [Paraburkholderia sp. BL6665CI2N2]
MARPREFDEGAVLDATMQCFWRFGYEATSVKDLTERTGLTAASLYNAYGDKRGLFQAALDRYVDESIGRRIQRCEALPPLEAIHAFFEEIVRRSLNDRQHKGCMIVNSAMEMAPHDAEFQKIIAGVLVRIEDFFLGCVMAGQSDGTIAHSQRADVLARHLLGVLMGVRVLARVRSDRVLLEGVIAPALALLQPPNG